MDSTRMMSLLAMVSVVATLSIGAPAWAADYNPPGKTAAAAVSGKTAYVTSRRHYGWSRYRIASWYASHYRYTNSAPAVVQPASWHSRPFVLMVGIAF